MEIQSTLAKVLILVRKNVSRKMIGSLGNVDCVHLSIALSEHWDVFSLREAQQHGFLKVNYGETTELICT